MKKCILVDYCNKAMLLYFSYFEEDSHDEPMWLNEDREKSTAEVMLFYITEIKKRLKLLGDEYIVTDVESYRLKKLIRKHQLGLKQKSKKLKIELSNIIDLVKPKNGNNIIKCFIFLIRRDGGIKETSNQTIRISIEYKILKVVVFNQKEVVESKKVSKSPTKFIFI